MDGPTRWLVVLLSLAAVFALASAVTIIMVLVTGH